MICASGLDIIYEVAKHAGFTKAMSTLDISRAAGSR